jgi:hypothetical protein
MQNDQTVGAACLAFSKAKAEACRARGCNDMMLTVAERIGKWLIAAQKRDHGDVGGLDYYHIGCGDW